ncbi:hypothetical protein JJ691_56810 [Kutzneria sp. CA-103260]|nr:hypothetical protein JJ691_56810 [Kutzneria sp. CA-103260]
MVNGEEIRIGDDGVLYDRSPWAGVSCTSYLWPYAGSREHFEVRRAIANMTHGLRYVNRPKSYSFLADDVDLADILQVVKAASLVLNAADSALDEVVAEAIACGATWKQVGDALGVQRTAAHKRFHNGLSVKRKTEISHDSSMVGVVSCYWLEQLSESTLGFDESDWEAVSLEMAIDHAIRNIVGAFRRIELWISTDPDQFVSDKEWRDSLFGIYDVVRKSFHVLTLKRSMQKFSEYVRKYPLGSPWAEHSAEVYFSHGVARLASTFHHFTKLWEVFAVDDDDQFSRQLAYVYHGLMEVQDDFARPEIVHTLAHIEQYVVESGDSVFLTGDRNEDVSSATQQELFDAFWKKDKRKMAEFLGVDKVDDAPSLDEILKRFE